METKKELNISTRYKVNRPRKITVINPSKYDIANIKNANKSYWKSVFDDLEKTSQQPSLWRESEEIVQVLPDELYQRVCKTLEMPLSPRPTFDKILKGKNHEKSKESIKMPMLSYRKSFTVLRQLDSDTSVETSPREEDNAQKDIGVEDIHREFLRRGVRDQVTWKSNYLEPERDEEKGLVKRANDLTDRIAQEFCDYMTELGGKHQSQLFTPKAIKELFQVEFDTHVARSLRIITKEMSCVSDDVVAATELTEKSKQSILDKHINEDLKAETKPSKTTAFTRAIPIHEQWRSPRNRTRQLWRSAKHIPKDLVTLKTVWDGITNLRSVKEYCRWMIEHPEFRRPPFLENMGMFDLSTLNARLTMESARLVTAPSETTYCEDDVASMEDIRKRLSMLVEHEDE